MFQLIPSGSREFIDRARAVEITEEWLLQIRQDLTGLVELVLTDRSYAPSAAQVIADFVTSTEHFNPCLADRVISFDMSDVIAGRNTEDGLAVLQILAQAFANASSLQHLNLSDNAMGSRGIPCCEALFNASHPLQSLSLCNNGLSLEAMQQVADWLVSRALAPRLQKVHFFNNMSGDEGCKAFQHLINHCSPIHLSNLRFASTRASGLGSQFIVTGLVELVQRVDEDEVAAMTHLDLTDNNLKGENAQILAQALRAMPLLEYLNLSDCDMEDEGLHVICSSLLEHKHITHLDLSGNDITAAGVSFHSPFVHLLTEISPNLKVLDMQDNEMTSKGVANITRVLSRGPSVLVALRLGCNECGPNGVTHLIRSANSFLPTLECLDMNRNYLSDDALEKLAETFGGALQAFDDNVDDSDFEDASVEEEEEEEDDEKEIEGVEEEEEEEEEEDEVDELTQGLSQVAF